MFKTILSTTAALVLITIVVAIPTVASAAASIAPTVSPIAVLVPTTITTAAAQYNYFFPTDEPSSNHIAARIMDHDHDDVTTVPRSAAFATATTPAAMGTTVQ